MRSDPTVRALERWLRNKTSEHFRTWLVAADNRMLVAELGTTLSTLRQGARSPPVLRSRAGMAKRWQWLGVLFSVVTVVSACGGESRNEPENPEPENPEPENTELECSEVRDQSLAILVEAEANAPAECRSASDCRLFTGITKCSYGCGWVVATTDEAPLKDAVDEANALCRDECRQPAPPCVPTKNVADCVSGKCVVVDELHREDCAAVRSKSLTLLSVAVANAPLACDSRATASCSGGAPNASTTVASRRRRRTLRRSSPRLPKSTRSARTSAFRSRPRVAARDPSSPSIA